MVIKTFIVDSFTNEMFKGNPAGVCLIDEPLKENLMLLIAKELGLSETAFVLKTDSGYSIRFFSPKQEIPLCGHATLASGLILFKEFKEINEVSFTSIQNLNLVTRRHGKEIIMDFPAYNTEPSTVSDEFVKALGLITYINCEYNKEQNVMLLEIEDSKTLRRLKPDFAELYKSHNSINGVVVTAQSDLPEYDFESRYFWPWAGTNEDPVTGMTHTILSKYWSKRLNKTKMKAFQCSERTGSMELELIDENNLTIKSTGQIVFEGVITL